MRGLIITLVLAAALAGGYFFYRQSAPQSAEKSGGLFETTTQAPPRRTAETCSAEHAVYEYNDDRRVMLRFRRIPSTTTQNFEVAEFQGRRMGNVEFVVQVTTTQKEYVYRPVNAGPDDGPAYILSVTNIRPAESGAAFPVTLFDSEMHYIGQLPRHDSRAPGYIFMPGMLPALYRDRVNQSPGVFRFQTCDEPADAATTTQ